MMRPSVGRYIPAIAPGQEHGEHTAAQRTRTTGTPSRWPRDRADASAVARSEFLRLASGLRAPLRLERDLGGQQARRGGDHRLLARQHRVEEVLGRALRGVQWLVPGLAVVG